MKQHHLAWPSAGETSKGEGRGKKSLLKKQKRGPTKNMFRRTSLTKIPSHFFFFMYYFVLFLLQIKVIMTGGFEKRTGVIEKIPSPELIFLSLFSKIDVKKGAT